MLQKYLDKLEFNVIISQLLQTSHTFIGKEIISKLSPSTNEDKVRKTLAETSEACTLIHTSGTFPISEIDDLNIQLKRIESGMSLSAKPLLEIATILKTSRELSTYYKDSELMLTNIGAYFDELYTNVDVEKKIFSSIISEDTIADNASQKLASIRRSRKNLELEIKNKLNTIIHSNTYSKYLMDPVVTMRSGRYVIPVKDEYRSQVKGFIHDTSSSGSTVYIEPMAVFELNNSIGNLLVDESREIERILENLSALLYPISGLIKQSYHLIGKLDFISSKATYSIFHNCSEPIIGNYIDFKYARHPLIDENKVVPINIHLGRDFRCLVITGPNTGGKTVTLKTVGLLCAMAQSGMHIPVQEGSTIKVFDNIFADIGDEQSIEESLSTFSSHMTNIAHILQVFTEKSLILVDELGSGTDPIEGAALAISLLENFYKNGACILATTHYHEIKNYAISNEGFENASCEFDLHTLKPTYHLLLGIPGKSNAFAISSKLGISQDIIDRASSLVSKPDTDIETLMKDIYDDKIQIEKDKVEIEKNLHQVEALRKSLETENSEKLKSEKAKIDAARREAKEILVDAKEEASRVIKSLNKLDSNDIKKANQLRNQLNDSLKKFGGDGLDFSGLLQLNNTSSPAPLKKNQKTGSVTIHNDKAQSASTEINLIGETVADAIQELDKYLDNCKMAHLHTVRIVHGKGTGKLREGIHSYLKKSKYVDSFHIAGFGEGDYGVTIVQLK